MELNEGKCVLVFVSTGEQWLCKLTPAATIWYHGEDKVDDEGSDNFSVQIRQSHQTFVKPNKRELTGSCELWGKESGRQKRSRCEKVSRCPCVPFVLSLLLSRLANISFFSGSPSWQNCKIIDFISNSFSSPPEYLRRVPDTFWQMRAIKVTLAQICWESSFEMSA